MRNGSLALMLAGLPLLAGNVGGDDSSISTSAPPPPPAASQPPVAPVASQPPSPPVKLSSGAAEIVKLAQAGVGEDVMLAYVGNVKSKFTLGSDQIVYLNDLGVTSPVIKAMIQHDDAIDAAARDYAMSQLPPTIPPPPTNPYPPAPTDDGSQPPMPPPDASANPLDNTGDYPVADDTDYFYNSLAPYGNWVDVAGCGLCWQPTVIVVNHDWRPYGDHGRWLYSDCGWYWQSDYSWGWAAFHYGRWFEDPRRGWVWLPGRAWAPAWVSWRRSQEYCGWAPLPPSARYFPGSGLAYNNHLAPANFEFGLKPAQYTFIPLARLTDYAPARYAASGPQAVEIAGQSTVINHYATQNKRVVNHGIAPEEVTVASGTEVRRVEILDLPGNRNDSVISDHLGKQGGGLVIYRPQLPTPSARRAPTVAAPARNSGNLKTSLNQVTPVAPAPAASLASAKPIVLSGATQPVVRPEIYPAGSLVVIGTKVESSPKPAPAPLPNMKFARPATADATPSQSEVSYQFKQSDRSSAVAQNGVSESSPVAAGFNFSDATHPANLGSANVPVFSPVHQNAINGNRQAESGQTAPHVIPAHYSVSQQVNANPQHSYTVSDVAPARERPAQPSRSENSSPPSPVESHAAEISHSAPVAAAHYEPPPAPHVSSPPASSAPSSSSSKK